MIFAKIYFVFTRSVQSAHAGTRLFSFTILDCAKSYSWELRRGSPVPYQLGIAESGGVAGIMLKHGVKFLK